MAKNEKKKTQAEGNQEAQEQVLQMVIFCLGEEEYALPITKVQEINRVVPVTRLPQTPAFVEGIINLRERSIPVLDIRKRFELAVQEFSDDTRFIIVEMNGQVVGIVVDAVREVVSLPIAAVEPPPPAFILDVQYIHGIGKLEERLLILLDIDKVLSNNEEKELVAASNKL